MKSSSKSWTIYTIQQRESRINPRPQYQRAAVWNLAKKQKLIDSILRGYDIPKIYLRESPDDVYEHEVVDGQQRLRAIWEFANNDFPLGDDSSDLPKWGDLSDRRHDELASDVQEDFGLFDLSIVVIEDSSELEIHDLFLRLQEGVSLNPAEKRNAMVGTMRDFVSKLADHSVFQGVRMSSNISLRYGKDDWIAHVVCLELAKGIVDLKAPDLKRMYETEQGFSSEGAIARKIKRVLNYLQRVLTPETPEMNIKWGFVDLYWLISRLDEGYVLKDREQDFQNFYRTFEGRRRGVDDIEELVQSSDLLDQDLFRYIEAFQRSGAVKKNIEIRHEVYKFWFHSLHLDLIPKDLRRDFTDSERLLIWRRSEEKCQRCGKSISFEEMEADHITPHVKGGTTTFDNAQCLCKPCNLSKSSSS